MYIGFHICQLSGFLAFSSLFEPVRWCYLRRCVGLEIVRELHEAALSADTEFKRTVYYTSLPDNTRPNIGVHSVFFASALIIITVERSPLWYC